MLEQVVQLDLHLEILSAVGINGALHTPRRQQQRVITVLRLRFNQIVYDREFGDRLVRMLLKEQSHRVFIREPRDQLDKNLLGHASILGISFKHVNLHDFADGQC